MERFKRLEMLIGTAQFTTLQKKRVAIFGIGGVGGYVVEALARSGIGEFDLIDHDIVAISNINRQIIATTDTIQQQKVEVAKTRILSINPKAIVHTHDCFFLPEHANDFDFSQYDYVVDAIDTVTGKIEIISRAKQADVPVISAMGTGNKMNPTMLEVADIEKTSVCPLARVVRQELRKRKIRHVKVVYSKEIPIRCQMDEIDPKTNKAIPGSTAFVPPVAGMIIASEVVKDLLEGV